MPIRLAIAWVFSFVLYMVIALMYPNSEAQAFTPFIGIMLSFIGLSAVFILGCPLYLASAWRWWVKHWYLSLILLTAGLGGLAVCLVPGFSLESTGTSHIFESFNPLIFFPAYILVMFALCWMPILSMRSFLLSVNELITGGEQH